MNKPIPFDAANLLIQNSEALLVNSAGYNNELVFADLDIDDKDENVIGFSRAGANYITRLTEKKFDTFVSDAGILIFQSKKYPDEQFKIALLEIKRIPQ